MKPLVLGLCLCCLVATALVLFPDTISHDPHVTSGLTLIALVSMLVATDKRSIGARTKDRK